MCTPIETVNCTLVTEEQCLTLSGVECEEVAARWPQKPSKLENPAAEQDSQPEMCGDVQERMQASAQNWVQRIRRVITVMLSQVWNTSPTSSRDTYWGWEWRWVIARNVSCLRGDNGAPVPGLQPHVSARYVSTLNSNNTAIVHSASACLVPGNRKAYYSLSVSSEAVRDNITRSPRRAHLKEESNKM